MKTTQNNTRLENLQGMLNKSFITALNNVGVFTVQDLLDNTHLEGIEALRRVRGIGSKAMAQIETLLNTVVKRPKRMSLLERLGIHDVCGDDSRLMNLDNKEEFIRVTKNEDNANAYIRNIMEEKLLDSLNKVSDNDNKKEELSLIVKLGEETTTNKREVIVELMEIKNGEMQTTIPMMKCNMNNVSESVVNPSELQLNVEQGELIEMGHNTLIEQVSHIPEFDSNKPLALNVTMMENCMIMDLTFNERSTAETLKSNKFIKDGVMINGMRWEIVAMTSSQARQGSCIIAPSHRIDQYRMILGNGCMLGVGKTAKQEARATLSLSVGTTMVVWEDGKLYQMDYTVKYIKDIKGIVKTPMIDIIEQQVNGMWEVLMTVDDGIKSTSFNSMKKDYDEGEIDKEAFRKAIKKNFLKEKADGFGLIDIRVACQWCYVLGLITKADMEYFIARYSQLEKGLQDPELRDASTTIGSIFYCMTTAFQIRHHFDKGLLVIDDLRVLGIDEDIVMPKAMHKLDDKAEYTPVWRVLNYNKPKRKYTSLTTQAVLALDFTFDLIKDLGDTTNELIEKIFFDMDACLEYCGIHENYSMKRGYDKQDFDLICDDCSQITAYLEANPLAFHDEYIKTKIAKLIQKAKHSLFRHKFRVEGDFYYMISDPRLIRWSANPTIPQNLLQSGEYFLNNIEKKVTLVRYPCVSFLNPRKVDLCMDDELWYLRDVFVMNTFDYLWLGLGGGDHDGDIVQVIFDERVVGATRIWPPMVNITTHDNSVEVENTKESRAVYYTACRNGSPVGIRSKEFVKYVSYVKHNNLLDTMAQRHLYLAMNVICENIIGKTIDVPKTAEVFKTLKELEEMLKNYRPDWLIGQDLVKEKKYGIDFDDEYNGDKPATKSNCPLGKFFRYAREEYDMLNGKAYDYIKKINFDYSEVKKLMNAVEKHISFAKIDLIGQYMEEIYKDYCGAMNNCRNLDKKDKKDDYNRVQTYYRNMFELVCREKGFDRKTAAYVLYCCPYKAQERVTDPTHRKSKAIGFVLAGEHLLELFRDANDNMISMKVPNVVNGTTLTVKDGKFRIRTKEYPCKLNDGEYMVFNTSKGSFIRISKDDMPVTAMKTLNEVLNDSSNTNRLYARNKQEKKLIENKSHELLMREGMMFMELLATRKYCMGNPFQVLHHLFKNSLEFEIDIILDNNRYLPVMKTIVNGKEEILGGLKGVDLSLAGYKFTINEDVLMNTDFFATKGSRKYPNGKFVRETILFQAFYAGKNDDNDFIFEYDNTIVFDTNYDVLEEDGVEVYKFTSPTITKEENNTEFDSVDNIDEPSFNEPPVIDEDDMCSEYLPSEDFME